MPRENGPVRPATRISPRLVHTLRSGGGLFTLLVTAGCVAYSPHPIDPAAHAQQLRARRLAAKTWTLRALYEEADRSAPDVAVARAQYETARAAILTAGERPNPTIALSPQIVTPYTSWIAGTYGVDFDWTFETAGKRSRRLEVARANANSAAAQVVAAVWKARAAVRKAALELYVADRRVALLGEAVARQNEVLQVLEERIQAGAESRRETVQPRILQAQLRLQAADAAKSASLARVALTEALGLSAEALSGVQFSLENFGRVPVRPTNQRRAALTHRADVVAALADYAAAEGSLRLEVAKQYPDVHLNPGYQLDTGENKWSLGIGLTLPILNQNRGPIREAEAKRKEAEARFHAVQARVLADCDRAWATFKAAQAKLATTEEMLSEQEKQLAFEQRLVTAGEGDKLALLSAKVERATTLTARLDALSELQAAAGALEEATQTPLEP